jgi:hypothetical protein
MSEGVPPDVADLLRTHIESYEALEIALLLGRRPDEPWQPDDVARELRLPPDVAATTLEELTAAGLVSRDTADEVRFHAHPDARPSLDRLQVAYRDHKIELMSLMTR